MNPNIEQWILEGKSFSSLSAEEQQEVLSYLSESSYNAILQTLQMAEQSIPSATNYRSRKNEILSHFDQKQSAKNNPVIIWKKYAAVASIVAVVSMGWALFTSLQKNNPIATVKWIHDTIQKIQIDTQWIKENTNTITASPSYTPPSSFKKINPIKKPENYAVSSPVRRFDGIPVLSLKVFDSLQINQSKPISQDPLIASFKFAKDFPENW